MCKPSRIPFLICLTILVYRSFKVVNREEKLLRAPLVEGAESSIMADKRLELPPQRVPLDPIYICCQLTTPLPKTSRDKNTEVGKGHKHTNHIPAVTSPQRHGPVSIHIRQILRNILECLDQVVIRLAAPITFDTIL